MTTLDDRLNVIDQKLDEILDRLDQMEGFRKELLTVDEAAQLLGVSSYTVRQYKNQFWSEGLHYFPQNKGDRYNRVLLEDWMKNRENPVEHKRAIDNWAMSQESQHRRRKK